MDRHRHAAGELAGGADLDAAVEQHDGAVAVAAGGPGQQVGAGEGGDEGVGRPLDELGRRAELAHPALHDHADAGGQRRGVLEGVADEQRRALQRGQQLLQLAAHHLPGVGIEGRERLVEQEHAGVAGQRARQGHALALAAGEPVGTRLGEVGDAEALQQLADALRAAEADVRPHGEVREQRVLLEHEADGALLGRQVEAPAAVEPGPVAQRDAARVGRHQTGHGAQHGGLPRPRRSSERHRLAPDAQLGIEAEVPKLLRDRDLEGIHEVRIFVESRIAALSTTSRQPMASATSKSTSSCS